MDQDLNALLQGLLARWEDEVVEFKRAGDDFETPRIGRYFSALSNEANLQENESAWLVFGVDNKSRTVVGTSYREDHERLQSLKHQIAQGTDSGITFRKIHVLQHPRGRVVLFEIPAAPRGMPVGWHSHYYARAGESLTALPIDKLDRIRQQTLREDWSAQTVRAATVESLDAAAVAKARELFAKKHANRIDPETVATWPVDTFLDRARLTRDGAITRTAVLLLGKGESAHLLSPHPAQLTWRLEGPERAYEHFGPPFLLNTTALYRRIRNIQVRLLPQDELIPMEIAKYDQETVLEALHNCIAHQDYDRGGRVVVTELPDQLVFENEGGFFDGNPEDFIPGDKTPFRYRNPFLTQAMVELNMIDTMGYGIHRMFRDQMRRYLPLPDYDLSVPNRVRLVIHGAVVDPAYTRLLIRETQLPFEDVLALDRIQKRLPISDEAARHLRRHKLIEGRKPNYRIAPSLARTAAEKVAYIHMRGQDDAFHEKQLLDYLREFGHADREIIDRLLMDKVSDALTATQKRNKVGNLIQKLRRRGDIHNVGSRGSPRWELVTKEPGDRT